MKLTKNFSSEEFQCPCCQVSIVMPQLYTALQKLRDLAGVPIEITSGYRCDSHNRKVGGKKSSLHVNGSAADIKIFGLTVKEMYGLAEQVPALSGIGVYPKEGFIHVDTRGQRARWARVDGKYVAVTKGLT